MVVAEVLPLPPHMRLITGRKVEREEPRNEERFGFPAVQETWEISCDTDGDWDDTASEQKFRVSPLEKRFSRPAVA